MKKIPARRRLTVGVRAIEERGLPLVKELARLARGTDPPPVKLEGALDILFGAFGAGDEPFCDLLLEGWLRARRDKRLRLAMAWLREQLRLSVEEIVAEGIAARAFRADLDPVVFSAVCLGAAEGCLLQSASQGGPVAPDELVKTLLRLAASHAKIE
ncbi:MAG: TetR family transcriptional regulator C-terminal domain-containing protein [Candidatus Rokubacteria bacterium]|nr:TetR family transcriptional regulator C-terminal domain-containing protein [Candidatus Rokubacteria bacterium]